MVRAFLRAMQGRSDHRLVLVRRFNRVDAEMSQVLATPEAKRLVVAVSHVSDEVLAALYRHARMLLFVSLYEGFGLPALEAMAMGVPVLASTAPAVEEITAKGALHANPHDEADIARNIRRLCEDDALRARLIAAGQQRAQDFPGTRRRAPPWRCIARPRAQDGLSGSSSAPITATWISSRRSGVMGAPEISTM